ncbi:uncharacterized protein LOC120180325 [Hibiscus syriacus]|uniref:uncharacterized protein LOC120180325 n=1 Tax=Hibiscus syriacus TaxID=106335 RepID=UPI00192210D3|nr:uncharacterized protein LOC120180325 [Hibiscus syriacus]
MERRFNDRFSGLPRHLHGGGFERSDHMEHMRGLDIIGPDIRPPQFRKGETLGHHIMPVICGWVCQLALVNFPTMNEWEINLVGLETSLIHDLVSQNLEVAFQFSLREFPNDDGVLSGDMDSFENLRKRKPVSTGWYRNCEVDCETVEGLDLHSQTREHQKMAMDMIVTIKQNAKKQNLTSDDHSIHNDSSKPKKAKILRSFE